MNIVYEYHKTGQRFKESWKNHQLMTIEQNMQILYRLSLFFFLPHSKCSFFGVPGDIVEPLNVYYVKLHTTKQKLEGKKTI